MKYIWGVFTAISLALFSCGSGSKESVENYGIIPMPNDITLSRGKYFLQGWACASGWRSCVTAG